MNRLVVGIESLRFRYLLIFLLPCKTPQEQGPEFKQMALEPCQCPFSKEKQCRTAPRSPRGWGIVDILGPKGKEGGPPREFAPSSCPFPFGRKEWMDMCPIKKALAFFFLFCFALLEKQQNPVWTTFARFPRRVPRFRLSEGYFMNNCRLGYNIKAFLPSELTRFNFSPRALQPTTPRQAVAICFFHPLLPRIVAIALCGTRRSAISGPLSSLLQLRRIERRNFFSASKDLGKKLGTVFGPKENGSPIYSCELAEDFTCDVEGCLLGNGLLAASTGRLKCSLKFLAGIRPPAMSLRAGRVLKFDAFVFKTKKKKTAFIPSPEEKKRLVSCSFITGMIFL
ncbi:hypothetical protein CEXT_810671 [Caerostris extrusa]|uniref:Uncharacterized protein n=1 Tax=Caerostris extrusa TaxID=172846 RepID=A0AAV4QN95_CAEEX|nr:hypothetical protein CEXT_810671 [Caerostris extrusa]